LVRQGYEFAISAVTKYEIYSGATPTQLAFWDSVLLKIMVIQFDENTVDVAVKINNDLRRKRKQIDIADLFIAATALLHNIPFATLNKKHFDRIEKLKLIG
jgi:tRNA(fMet)-specific endonuclease VapC